MNKPLRKTLESFEFKSILVLILLSVLRGGLLAVPLYLLGAAGIGLLTNYLEFPTLAQQVLVVLNLGLNGGLFLRGFLPWGKFRRKERAYNLHQNATQRAIPMPPQNYWRRDELCLIHSLALTPAGEGTSEELREQYLMSATETLLKLPPRYCAPHWNWRRSAGLALLVGLITFVMMLLIPGPFSLSNRYWFPFAVHSFEDDLTIHPGNAEIEWGGNLEIKVVMKKKSLRKPVVYVKAVDGWLSLPGEVAPDGAHVFQIKNVVEPLIYRLKWKNDWSKKYLITPTKTLSIARFDVSIKNPDYAGGATRVQVTPELRGLAGAVVKLTGEATLPIKAAKLLFSDGTELDAGGIKNSQFIVQFPINKSIGYGFYIQSHSGKVLNNNNLYTIELVPDLPPRVKLLSPDKDLMIGQNEKLPITISADDDLGIKEIDLAYQIHSGALKFMRLKSYEQPRPSCLDTFYWDLGEAKLTAGDMVRFRIDVRDGNYVTGPGAASTEWRYIEIASFEKTHDDIEEELEKWREKIMDTLADVHLQKDALSKDAVNYDQLSANQSQIQEKSKSAENMLKNILSQMAEDPYVDYSVWLEHESIAESMSHLNDTSMKTAKAALQTRNQSGASVEMDRIASDLERMYSLSDQLSKSQRARDMMESGNDLEDMGEDLLAELDRAQKFKNGIDPDQMKKINDLLKEANKILQEMAEALSKMPQELPDDFINQEAMKNLPIGESQDLMSKISQAMAKNDMESALGLAKQFLEMVKKMRENINEAHQSYVDDNSASKLAGEIEKKQGELEEIIKEEKQLHSETKQLDVLRIRALMKFQEQLLVELYKKQEAVINKTNAAVAALPDGSVVRGPLSGLVGLMREVSMEFKNGKLDKTKTIIPSMLVQLAQIEGIVCSINAKGNHCEKMREIKSGEQAIWDQLNLDIILEDVYSREDKNKFADLAKRQLGNTLKSTKVRESLQELTRRTASIDENIDERLKEAGVHMQSAEAKLREESSSSAVFHEEKALESLSEAQNMLGETLSALQQMAAEEKSGEGKAGGSQPRMIIKGSQIGSTGARAGRVRIPTADEYRPPREFREEIMDSLKEKYPELYKEIILKYFRRLAD